MRLKLTLERRSGTRDDVVVVTESTATVGDIADELVMTDPDAGPDRPAVGSITLSIRQPGDARHTELARERIIGEVSVVSGCTVSVTPQRSEAGHREATAATLRVLSGPDAGQQFSLPAGPSVIGRDLGVDVRLSDPLVSKRHARVEVGANAEIVDLNSANGIVVDGAVVNRTTLSPGQSVRLGDTDLVVATLATASSVAATVTGGAELFNRSPRVEARYAERQHPRPSVPREAERQAFPWLMLMAPVVMGTSMFAITGNPTSLLFVAMAPLMMLGNFATKSKRSSRQVAGEVHRFEEQLRLLEQTLLAELPQEHAVRQNEAPPVASILAAARDRSELLWTRRPEHWSFSHVRLATAVLPSRNTLGERSETDEGIPAQTQLLQLVEDRYRRIADVPVVESLLRSGGLGFVGSSSQAMDAARGVVVQLCGLHSPAELVVCAVSAPADVSHLDWLRWLPHTSSPQSPLSGPHLVDSAASITKLLAELEQVVLDRSADVSSRSTDLGALATEQSATTAGGRIDLLEPEEVPQLPLVVVLVAHHASYDRPRMAQLCERGRSVGIVPIFIGERREHLPAVCRTFVDVSGGMNAAEVHFVRHGLVVAPSAVEGVGIERATEFAMALAPLVDSAALVEDDSDIPRSVSFASLVTSDVLDEPTAVLERWRQNSSIHDRSGQPAPRRRPGTLRALVGQCATDAMHLDLRTQGPHALVGGTTGAGKSEFLQAWVMGMATEYSPDRVTFLFVDYKGGAAFADCVELPHCVGLVTDLDAHLVRRVLTSLRAELRHREHLLNKKQAKDLLELERRGDPESPPALILVIDEFAALVGEIPEFVDGVVDIAQRGRSLGIHLIMATQRPAGVIRDNLRANTNLRIALRMADEADSSDVVGTQSAAHFDPTIPGRALAKVGPGRLVPFQSAYLGGHTSTERERAEIEVKPLRFGVADVWRRPEEVLDPHSDSGPTDQQRLLSSVQRASFEGGIPSPRRPWLDDLSAVYDLAKLSPRTDEALILGVCDLPEKQSQERLAFHPDVDGNLAVFGTGGSGKTVLLRTLAAGAGITPRGGPLHVYALDFAAGGLRMLEVLPHVGAVVSGEDDERVMRLLRMLRAVADQRARDYRTVDAGSVSDYRARAEKPDEPRILLLIDNFPAFRESYDVGGERGRWYSTLIHLMGEGRQLGIHVVFTADRPGSVPGSISASVPRRVVLRLADDASYMVLGVPNDVLTPGSPPGRAIIDDIEVQVAVLGTSGNVADQSRALGELAQSMRRRSHRPAPSVGSMPSEVSLIDLPGDVDSRPVLGIAETTLAPIGFDPVGTFIIGGAPGSGRSNAVAALSQSLRRWAPDLTMTYVGPRRSATPTLVRWDHLAHDPDDVAALSKELAERARDPQTPPMAVVIEALADFGQTPADAALLELVRALKRNGHFVLAEAESSSWTSMFPLFSELRSGRKGLLLQPEFVEGDTILKTSFPRFKRSEFPIGRGMAVMGGQAVRLQVPIASRGPLPIPEMVPAS